MEKEKMLFCDGRFLKEGPIKEPEAVIHEFYEVFSIEEVKVMLWRLFKGAVGSERSAFITPHKEIGDMIFFLEAFIMLNMAVYELNQRTIKTD